MKKTLLTILGLAAISLAGVNAQVVINNSTSFTYSQNFDTLATSGTSNTWTDNETLVGWYSNRTVYISTNGSSATGGLLSLGTGASSDRALGALSSGSALPVFGLILQNNSGSSILLSDIKLSFTGEQWRASANAQALVFSYQVSPTALTSITSGTYTANTNLNFTAPQTLETSAAIDGNNSANQVSFSNISVADSGTLANGEYLGIRWSKTGTTSPSLGIDDFQLSVVPEPSTWALIGLGTAFVLWRIRRKPATRA
jgi:hypothetical protein